MLPGSCAVSRPEEPPGAGRTSYKTKQENEEGGSEREGEGTAETWPIPYVPSKSNVPGMVAHTFDSSIRKAKTDL